MGRAQTSEMSGAQRRGAPASAQIAPILDGMDIPFTELSTQDLRTLTRHAAAVRPLLARRGAAERLDELLALDAQRRALLSEVEGLRAEQNRARPNGRPSEEQRAVLAGLAQARRQEEAKLEPLQARVEELMLSLPNVLAPDVPDTEDEVVRVVGEAGKTGAEHTELVGDWIEFEAAARMSGSRFAYLKGPLVRLQMALISYALDAVEAEGFTPVVVPVLVHKQALLGTGFLPDAEGQLYQLVEDDLYLTGTSEVALASLHADELLDAEELPLRYAGLSTCFRREAGAAGKDTRGIIRMHQFDKVEMFSYVTPADSLAEHERILAVEERILGGLDIPYRVVNIPVTDLGNPAAKKYDCEAWLPGQGRYRELTSCSNTTDYQTRRLRIRAKGEHGTHGVHTLNGTACAVGRTIIAVLENGQDEGGAVHVPDALVRYGAPARIERP